MPETIGKMNSPIKKKKAMLHVDHVYGVQVRGREELQSGFRAEALFIERRCVEPRVGYGQADAHEQVLCVKVELREREGDNRWTILVRRHYRRHRNADGERRGRRHRGGRCD